MAPKFNNRSSRSKKRHVTSSKTNENIRGITGKGKVVRSECDDESDSDSDKVIIALSHFNESATIYDTVLRTNSSHIKIFSVTYKNVLDHLSLIRQ